jgi:hypothetical protein
MKIPYLPIIVATSALSLVSANAMPDLGRETGKFIRKDQSVPKNVRTFEPAKSKDSKGDFSFIPPDRPQGDICFIPPDRPTGDFCFIPPDRPIQVA